MTFTDEQARERAAVEIEREAPTRLATIFRAWVDGREQPASISLESYRETATTLGRALLTLEARVKELKHVIDNGHLRAISKREDELEAERDEQQRRADGFAVQHEELHARLADALRERDLIIECCRDSGISIQRREGGNGWAITNQARRETEALREQLRDLQVRITNHAREPYQNARMGWMEAVIMVQDGVRAALVSGGRP